MMRLLEVPVVQVMTTHPAAIELEASLGEAAGRMVEGGFRHLPVIDADEHVVGMLSERDLRERLGVEVERFPEASSDVLEGPVEPVMRPDPVTLERERARLRDVLEVLADERVGAVPVLDEAERLVGIVSYVDVLQFLREQDVTLAIRAPGAPPKEPRRSAAKRTSRPRRGARKPAKAIKRSRRR